MKLLVKTAGLLLLLAGAAVVMATGFGLLDPWIAEHWTCASNRVRRECGTFEATWSVLSLGGAAMLVGGIAALLASDGPRGGSSAAFTLDLSRLRRR